MLDFSIPSGCQTVWIQIRPDILLDLIWVQTVCKDISRQQNSPPPPPPPPADKELRYKTTYWYYFLAKTLAKVNFIWLQLFPFGLSVGYNKFCDRVTPGFLYLWDVYIHVYIPFLKTSQSSSEISSGTLAKNASENVVCLNRLQHIFLNIVD